jgi:hypothetical protein
MRRWINIALILSIVFLSASGGYYWCHRVSVAELSTMVNRVQANSAFNRIVEDGQIVDLMKRTCYEDALKMLEWNVKDQTRIMADLVREGVGPDFVKYVEDRAPGLLASGSAQLHTTQGRYEIRCPR